MYKSRKGTKGEARYKPIRKAKVNKKENDDKGSKGINSWKGMGMGRYVGEGRLLKASSDKYARFRRPEKLEPVAVRRYFIGTGIGIVADKNRTDSELSQSETQTKFR